MSKHKHEQGQSSNEMKPENEQTQNQESQPLVPEVEVQPGAEEQQGNHPGAVNTPEAQLAAAKAEIELLKTQFAELNDKYLRTLAEQVNFRKRVVKEKEEFQQYAVSTLLNDLIPVLDDFDRSLEAVAQHQNDASKVVDGIRLIQKRLYDTLSNKYGLSRYESNGGVFDPRLHEAMFSDQGDVPEPTVTQEFMPGYKLHDRVVRTAKVKVTMPANQNGAASQSTETPADEQNASSDESASGDNAS
ncbi:MAG: nucleotide exchange factor GrpE [Rectinema sp.]|jgi:molecular chaperone GrpE